MFSLLDIFELQIRALCQGGSGNLTPSEADKNLTYKTKEAGKLMSIEVLDHLIIADQGFYSFADEGLL